ncbi:MAG TPA: hypothetical protein PKL83_05735, partial [bacterium]|nr:hypothetical protein [bacterium]
LLRRLLFLASMFARERCGKLYAGQAEEDDYALRIQTVETGMAANTYAAMTARVTAADSLAERFLGSATMRGSWQVYQEYFQRLRSAFSGTAGKQLYLNGFRTYAYQWLAAHPIVSLRGREYTLSQQLPGYFESAFRRLAEFTWGSDFRGTVWNDGQSEMQRMRELEQTRRACDVFLQELADRILSGKRLQNHAVFSRTLAAFAPADVVQAANVWAVTYDDLQNARSTANGQEERLVQDLQARTTSLSEYFSRYGYMFDASRGLINLARALAVVPFQQGGTARFGFIIQDRYSFY